MISMFNISKSATAELWIRPENSPWSIWNRRAQRAYDISDPVNRRREGGRIVLDGLDLKSAALLRPRQSIRLSRQQRQRQEKLIKSFSYFYYFIIIDYFLTAKPTFPRHPAIFIVNICKIFITKNSALRNEWL